MSSPFGPEARAAIIRHPFFLAGLATVGLLGLMAGVLVLFDSVSGNSEAGSPTVTVAQTTSTPGPIRLTAVASGVIGRTTHVATVRTAPGTGSPVLGTLPSNTDIEVDARTTDANWLRVIFPPNSELHGWIDANDLELTGEASALVVATAEPPPIIELPTESPDVLTAIAEQQTIDASAALETETPTPTPVGATGLPDLVVGTAPVLNAGQLFITVVNQGEGDATGDLVVAVLDAEGTVFLGGATLPNFTLPAGRSVDIGTGYTVTSDQTLLLIVDPGGIMEEFDNFNNRITIAIATGIPPTPLPLVPPEGEPPTEPPVEEPIVP